MLKVTFWEYEANPKNSLNQAASVDIEIANY